MGCPRRAKRAHAATLIGKQELSIKQAIFTSIRKEVSVVNVPTPL